MERTNLNNYQLDELLKQDLWLDSETCLKYGLIDEIIAEPLGGAHRNYDQASSNLSKVILKNLDELTKLPIDVLIEKRYERLMSYGSI